MAAEGEVAAGWAPPTPAEVAVRESWWLAAGAGDWAACEERAQSEKRCAPVERMHYLCLIICDDGAAIHLVQSSRVPGATCRVCSCARRVPVSTAARVVVCAWASPAGSAADTWRYLRGSTCHTMQIVKLKERQQTVLGSGSGAVVG